MYCFVIDMGWDSAQYLSASTTRFTLPPKPLSNCVQNLKEKAKGNKLHRPYDGIKPKALRVQQWL